MSQRYRYIATFTIGNIEALRPPLKNALVNSSLRCRKRKDEAQVGVCSSFKISCFEEFLEMSSDEIPKPFSRSCSQFFGKFVRDLVDFEPGFLFR